VSDDPTDYFAALTEAHQQGYDFTSIADYHASQGWDAPQQPDMGTLLAGNIGLGQYNANIAGYAYQNYGQTEQDLLAQPQNPNNPVQPTWTQPLGSAPGDASTPGTNDTDQEGATAPWEGNHNQIAPPADQDI
jgi:hypothetical protein